MWRERSLGLVRDKKLKLNELFYSIQGESSWVGKPTVFVRLTGCNLRCNYCDSQYSYQQGEMVSLSDLIERIVSYSCRHVCITGGEPLLQKPVTALMEQLCDLGYFVSLETSGSISCQEVDQRVKIILDVKTPGSGAPNSFLLENLQFATQTTEFKFVISSENDFLWAEAFASRHGLFDNHVVLYSPAFDVVEPKWLAQKILFARSRAQLQLQLHKYIWSPSERGV